MIENEVIPVELLRIKLGDTRHLRPPVNLRTTCPGHHRTHFYIVNPIFGPHIPDWHDGCGGFAVAMSDPRNIGYSGFFK